MCICLYFFLSSSILLLWVFDKNYFLSFFFLLFSLAQGVFTSGSTVYLYGHQGYASRIYEGYQKTDKTRQQDVNLEMLHGEYLKNATTQFVVTNK